MLLGNYPSAASNDRRTVSSALYGLLGPVASETTCQIFLEASLYDLKFIYLVVTLEFEETLSI